MYEKSNCAVKIQNKITNFFQCERGVRQGCPIGPILFNICTDEKAYKLEGINPAPLELPNGTLVSCLMYADNIIILSRSPEGLQKLLDHTDIYCNNWKMTVNKSKTKCMTSSSKNKKNTKDLFAIDSCHLENINKFTYLGLKIDATGSLSASATATTLFQHMQNLGHVNNLDILTTPKINTEKLL